MEKDEEQKMTKAQSMNTKLEKLKRQQATLKVRIQKMEATEKQKARKQDVRRKILIGAYVLEQAKREGSVDHLKRELLGYLKRDSDKILFADL